MCTIWSVAIKQVDEREDLRYRGKCTNEYIWQKAKIEHEEKEWPSSSCVILFDMKDHS